MKIAIAEDDPIMAEHLSFILKDLGYDVCGVGHNVSQVKLLVEKEQPDLLLLDIRMEEIDSGIQVAQFLNERNIPFAFLSAHTDDQTLNLAGNLSPISFLVKPYNKAQIKATLGTFFGSINNEILLKIGRESVLLKKNEILYIHTEKNYCEIYSLSGREVIRCSLTTLLSDIDSAKLIRVHKSYAVNKDRITKKLHGSLFLGNIQIPTSTVFYS